MPINTIRCLILLLLLLIFAFFFPLTTATAQGESAYDLINTINALRASLNLEPYQVDSWLMSYAQEHAEYLASIHRGTHEHRDGSLPWEIGLQENVASGEGITVKDVVYNIWVDEGHRKTMIGYSSGLIGAGIAPSDDGQVYYTINIRPGKASETITPLPHTSIPFIPFETNTPQPDGAIIHVVRSGETLWTIAISYGVTMDEIRRLNGLAANATLIYNDQRLLIRYASSINPTLPGTSPSLSPQIIISPSSTVAYVPTYTETPKYPATPPSFLTNTPSNLTNVKSEKIVENPKLLIVPGILAILAASSLVYWIWTNRDQPGK